MIIVFYNFNKIYYFRFITKKNKYFINLLLNLQNTRYLLPNYRIGIKRYTSISGKNTKIMRLKRVIALFGI